jgi:hypothetical protein
VKSPGILQRHPALRWIVPLGVVSLAGVAVAGALRSPGPSETLPDTVPAALVSAVEHSQHTGFSGTVVSQLSLGLPLLAALPGSSRAKRESSFSELLEGSHTMQVWYGGRSRQRVAVLGAGDETDLFRNGRDLWQWSSADGVAVHTRLHRRADVALGDQPAEGLTPAALAEGALAALDSDTALSVDDDDVVVADRRAYELVLTPHDNGTKIGSVRVAIDGLTKVPLGVQVYPKGSASAAIDVAFTSIRFGMPAERNFDFVPPPNATVHTVQQHAASALVSGSGWTSVYRLPTDRRRAGRPAVPAEEFRTMSAVSGHWGRGRLVESPLLSMLVTKDGRVYAGAVRPARLYAVAASAAKK